MISTSVPVLGPGGIDILNNDSSPDDDVFMTEYILPDPQPPIRHPVRAFSEESIRIQARDYHNAMLVGSLPIRDPRTGVFVRDFRNPTLMRPLEPIATEPSALMPVNTPEFPNHLESSAPQCLFYLSSTLQNPGAKPFSTTSNMFYESSSALQPHNPPTVLRGPGGINLLDSPCNSPVLMPIGETSSSSSSTLSDLNLDDQRSSSSLHPESSTSDYKDYEEDAAHSDMSYHSNRHNSPFDDPEFSGSDHIPKPQPKKSTNTKSKPRPKKYKCEFAGCGKCMCDFFLFSFYQKVD
ncbi:UNVERIFIED_CONTAM: hypothetical protein HDU68_003441 [Siphonaria sp. JEL0065]|nr:hypothetical protein HDU68_003441 [Siphonaria sp. JEL0065]